MSGNKIVVLPLQSRRTTIHFNRSKMTIGIIDPLLIGLAALPGLFICWYIYRKDRYEHEPKIFLLFAFLAGALATFPIIALEEWLDNHAFLWRTHWLLELLVTAILTALNEELVKFAVLVFLIFPWRFFDEPLDGIVYSVILAMGFATTENILYGMEYGLGTTILRAFTAVPAHLVFAIIMGYYVGLAKFNTKKRNSFLLMSLALSVAAHSVYDFLIFQKIYEGLIVLAVVFVWLAIYFEQELIKDHQEHSPFKNRR